MSVKDEILALIKRCGGPNVIQAASQDGSDPILSDRTPYKWPRHGIPEKHWGLLRELSGVTPDELHALNEKLRENRHRSSQAESRPSA